MDGIPKEGILVVELSFLIFETALLQALSLGFEAFAIHHFGANLDFGNNRQFIKFSFACFDCALVIAYLIVRYSYYFGIPTIEGALDRIGCCSFGRNRPKGHSENKSKSSATNGYYLSRTARNIGALHALSFIVLCLYQHYYVGSWSYYGLDNYFLNRTAAENYANGGELLPSSSMIDYTRAGSMLLFHPIKEEFIFRVTMVPIFRYRFKRADYAVLGAATIFGLIHAANLFSGRFAFSYVVLQCSFAFLCGMFYSLQFLLTNNVWNVIFLHMTNNLFSSFVPAHRAIDVSDPIVFGLLAFTCIIYGAECRHGFRKLHEQKDE